ncbi:MAG: hypothetical protein ABIS01_06255 [Ferruginibacter sp.]
MQDEELDNMDELIREASKSHHPVYDAKGWEKMEILLDKHLPQNGGRRRPVIIYLLPLLIAATVFLAWFYTGNKREAISTADNEAKVTATTPAIPTGNKRPEEAALATNTKINNPMPAILLPCEKIKTDDGSQNIQHAKKLSINHGNLKISFSGAINENADQKEPPINDISIVPEKDEQDLKSGTPNLEDPTISKAKDGSDDSLLPPPINDGTAINATNADLKVPVINPKESTFPSKQKGMIKASKGFAGKFAITLSAGPDLSFVGLDDPGKTRMTFGGGLSYKISNRITVSSGFYISKKIYSAQPSDYHPPKGYWTNYADLQRVDADCNVYEIPLAASYHFKQSKKHNWFAGIGFSSFIMKRETYNYFYKDQWGRPTYKKWTIQNQNKHYLSVLTISGGYQYRVNRNFSILAAPYLKLPLSGIGFGKIKLNSSGILLTASIQPFAKRK